MISFFAQNLPNIFLTVIRAVNHSRNLFRTKREVFVSPSVLCAKNSCMELILLSALVTYCDRCCLCFKAAHLDFCLSERILIFNNGRPRFCHPRIASLRAVGSIIYFVFPPAIGSPNRKGALCFDFHGCLRDEPLDRRNAEIRHGGLPLLIGAHESSPIQDFCSEPKAEQ